MYCAFKCEETFKNNSNIFFLLSSHGCGFKVHFKYNTKNFYKKSNLSSHILTVFFFFFNSLIPIQTWFNINIFRCMRRNWNVTYVANLMERMRCLENTWKMLITRRNLHVTNVAFFLHLMHYSWSIKMSAEKVKYL